MGIFEKGIEIAADIVGGTIGAIQATGEIIEEITENIMDKGEEIIKGIKKWVKKNILGIEEAPRYDPREANIEETKKINELLDKCIKNYSREAQEYDESAKLIIQSQFELLEAKLTEINNVSKDKIIIDDYIFQIFKNNSRYIIKNLDKIYSKQISNVFSLNNNKLLDILRMDAGIEKGEKIRELAINTIVEANQMLIRELTKFIKEQQEFVSIKLKEYIKNRKDNLITAKSETEKILKNSMEDKNYRLKMQEEYESILKNLNLLQNILGEEKC